MLTRAPAKSPPGHELTMHPQMDSAARARLMSLFGTMLLIRTVESTLAKIFADGEVPGFIHLSIGQEAVAAGVGSALIEGDTLATTHRGHGHVLAMGLDLNGFFKEILGKDGGVCRGRGGSMHVSDMSRGIIGANGIVGAGIPIALGSALALRSRPGGNVAVALFGDGAMSQGVLHESTNLAKLMKLPLLLVCENNGWSEFSPTEKQFAGTLAGLAQAFHVDYQCVDGDDVVEVAAAAGSAVGRLRAGEGPSILECRTHRARGHFEGDAQQYRAASELSSAATADPLSRAQALLQKAGMSDVDIARIKAGTESRVKEALEQARQDKAPDFQEAFDDVYTVVRGA